MSPDPDVKAANAMLARIFEHMSACPNCQRRTEENTACASTPPGKVRP